MGDLTIAQMEAYVRAAWESVEYTNYPGSWYRPYHASVYPGSWYRPYDELLSLRSCVFILAPMRTCFENWQAAYDFTLAHEEKIKQVDEEIYFVKNALCGDTGCVRCEAGKRTLGRLQSIKAELQRGMKSEGGNRWPVSRSR